MNSSSITQLVVLVPIMAAAPSVRPLAIHAS